jgi:hypothetical protein
MSVYQVTIAKTHTVEVNRAKLEAHVQEFIWAYGLKQVLNDAGSAGKTPEEKLAMAQKKLDALYAGQIGTTRTSDPVAARAKAIAKDKLNKAFKAKGLDPADEATGFGKLWAELAQREDIRALAQAQIDAEKELDIDIEL